MDDEEGKDVSVDLQPMSKNGKIINRLEKGEERDSNQMEQVPDAFAAEQTYLDEAGIAQAQQRKGSYDELDQEMGGQEPPQINSAAITSAFSKLESTNPSKPADLTGMFDNMQISVVGGQPEEIKSDGESSANESGEDLAEDYF